MHRTPVSPPRADGGLDIVAGSGPLGGVESPPLVVQATSGEPVADHPTLQSLIDPVQDTQAVHGPIVSWNGFTEPVRRRVDELFFRVRLRGREEGLDNFSEVYEQRPGRPPAPPHIDVRAGRRLSDVGAHETPELISHAGSRLIVPEEAGRRDGRPRRRSRRPRRS